MTSILRYMAVLDDWSLAGEKLRMRFVPDYFNIALANPVLLVETQAGLEMAELERRIHVLEQGLIDDVEMDDSGVYVSLDNLDSPVHFPGPATCSYADYELRDCLKAIEAYGRICARHEGEMYRLRRIVNGALSFIDQTVARIEKKQELSHQSHEEYGRQIELLHRVRRKLQSDD